MDPARNVDFSLAHPVDVSQALQHLAHHLGCENWYVVCHHERLFVFRLTQGAKDRYAVKIECSAPMEKGVYHGSKTSSFAITPLHAQMPLTSEQVTELRAGMAEVSRA